MKFKSLLVVLVSGLICLPFMSYGQDDIASLRQKAEQGDAAAQTMLGACYAIGEGVPHDYKEAMKWYRLAAEQGNADAQFSLGLAYDFGVGIPMNYAKARRWYHEAAMQGHSHAQDALKNLYLNCFFTLVATVAGLAGLFVLIRWRIRIWKSLVRNWKALSAWGVWGILLLLYCLLFDTDVSIGLALFPPVALTVIYIWWRLINKKQFLGGCRKDSKMTDDVLEPKDAEKTDALPNATDLPPWAGKKEYEGIGRCAYFFLIVVSILILGWLSKELYGSGAISVPREVLFLWWPVSVTIFFVILAALRLNNIGKSGWWALLVFIPLISLVVVVPCLMAPEGYADTKKLDLPGKIIGGLLLAQIGLLILAGLESISHQVFICGVVFIGAAVLLALFFMMFHWRTHMMKRLAWIWEVLSARGARSYKILSAGIVWALLVWLYCLLFDTEVSIGIAIFPPIAVTIVYIWWRLINKPKR